MLNKVIGAVAASVLLVPAMVATASSAGAASVSRCGNDSLTISHNRTQGAAGHGNVVVRFHNTSGRTCSLRGYPGIDALAKNGTVLAHAKRVKYGYTGGTHHIRTVVLTPGTYASADVEWMNFNPTTSGACAYSHSLAITAANTSAVHYRKVHVSVCALEVHPTVAGKSGNG